MFKPKEKSRVASLKFKNTVREAFGFPRLPYEDPEFCGGIYRDFIEGGFRYTHLVAAAIADLGGECVKLARSLELKTVSSTYITCGNCTANDGWSSSDASGRLQLCLAKYGTPSQTSASGLVLRELIRMCGGMDLDAWAISYYLRNMTPTNDIKLKMCQGSGGTVGPYKWGMFMVWTPSLGELHPMGVLGDGTIFPLGGSLVGSGPTSGWGYTGCP